MRSTSFSAASGVVQLVLDQPQLHRQRDEPLLRAVVEVALESPRRSSSPAVTMRSSRARDSSAIAAAEATASISSGSSSSDAS